MLKKNELLLSKNRPKMSKTCQNCSKLHSGNFNFCSSECAPKCKVCKKPMNHLHFKTHKECIKQRPHPPCEIVEPPERVYDLQNLVATIKQYMIVVNRSGPGEANEIKKLLHDWSVSYSAAYTIAYGEIGPCRVSY